MCTSCCRAKQHQQQQTRFQKSRPFLFSFKRLRDITRRRLSHLNNKVEESDERAGGGERKEKNKCERKKSEKMLQKAKSIKKTLKTEAKAIAYGTERVDKRGKPVT